MAVSQFFRFSYFFYPQLHSIFPSACPRTMRRPGPKSTRKKLSVNDFCAMLVTAGAGQNSSCLRQGGAAAPPKFRAERQLCPTGEAKNFVLHPVTANPLLEYSRGKASMPVLAARQAPAGMRPQDRGLCWVLVVFGSTFAVRGRFRRKCGGRFASAQLMVC